MIVSLGTNRTVVRTTGRKEQAMGGIVWLWPAGSKCVLFALFIMEEPGDTAVS